MSLDHKSKMRWCTLSFVVILREYGLLLKKPFAINIREVIWVVSFDSLLKPDPYVNVDDVMGYDPNWWRVNVNHESASWNKDLTSDMSQIHVVEWDMSLFWILNGFTQKINNMLMWRGLLMR